MTMRLGLAAEKLIHRSSWRLLQSVINYTVIVMSYPTQSELKQLLNYDLLSGELFWTSDRNNKTRSGDRAGCVKIKESGNKYRQISFNRHTCLEHRLIFIYMTGSAPIQIDHINGDGTDNRWVNLRSVDAFQNMKNQKISTRNRTGVFGVFWNKQKDRWTSQASNLEGRIILGNFEDFFEAVCSRKSAEVRYNYHENHGRITNRK